MSPARARYRRSGTTLMAHGEPWVWLTAGALALALLMIGGLVFLVLKEGVSTFWPGSVLRVRTVHGPVHLGEEFRDETYSVGSETLAALAPEALAQLRLPPDGERATAHRRLLRTGNFELPPYTHFTWVSDFELAEEGVDRPEWALVIERLTWGRFYGVPTAFVVDGEPAATGPEESWALFREHHPRLRRLWRQRRSLEVHEVGRVNRALEAARLKLRTAELRRSPPSGEFLAVVEEFEAAREQGRLRFEEIAARIAALNEEMGRYRLLMATAAGQETALSLSEIVRAYPANQQSLAGKVRIYLSRWWEFLTADPREANMEGGVLPAIFGTVVMTLLMSLAVVPLGVLAALYLREYARAGPLISAVRVAVNNLAGVPSIVFGVFGLGFFCYGVGRFLDAGPSNPWPPWLWFAAGAGLLAVAALASLMAWMGSRKGADRVRWAALGRVTVALWILAALLVVLLVAYTPFFQGFHRAKLPSPTFGTGGVLWASLTLALLTLPVVIVSTEEALAAVPRSMREGSYACGASKWQTIRRIVLPRAMPGIMTGTILAMARGAGEVAPLMLVGAVKLAPELPVDGVFPYLHLERSFMHLGFHIYDLGFQSQNSEAAKPMVFTTTLLLIGIIVALNLAAVMLRARLRRRFVSGQF